MADNYRAIIDGEDRLSDKIKNISSNLKDAGEKSKAVDEISKRFDKLDRSAAPISAKIGQMTKMIAELRSMGVEGGAALQEMTMRAAQYRDAMDDTRASIRALASDHVGLDVAVGSINVLAQAAQTAAGIYGLFSDSEEDVAAMTKNIASVMAVANGVQSLANLLNKDSALIQGIKALQLKASMIATRGETTATIANTATTTANTAATGANTIATKAATVARKALNATLLANPYVLLTAGIVAATAALWAYTSSSQDAKRAEEERNKRLEEEKKLLEDVKEATDGVYNNNYATKVSKDISMINKLSREYRNLKSASEQLKYIQDHKNEFQDLELPIKDLSSAEDVLVNNTGKYVDALKLRAEANANFMASVSAMQKRIELETEAEQYKPRGQKKFKAGDTYDRNSSTYEWLHRYGLDYNSNDYVYPAGSDFYKKLKLTEKGAAKLNKAGGYSEGDSDKFRTIQEQINRLKQQESVYLDKSIELGEQASRILTGGKTATHTTKKNNNSQDRKAFEERVEKAVAEMAAQREAISPDKHTSSESQIRNLLDKSAIIKAKIASPLFADDKYELEKQLSANQKELEELYSVERGSLDDINGWIRYYKDQAGKYAIGSNEYQSAMSQVDKYEKMLPDKKASKTSNPNTIRFYEDELSRLNEEILDIDVNTSAFDEAKKRIEELSRMIDVLNGKEVELKVGSLAYYDHKLDEIEEKLRNTNDPTEIKELFKELKTTTKEYDNAQRSIDPNALPKLLEITSTQAGQAGQALNGLGQAFSNIASEGEAAKAGAILAAVGTIIQGFANAMLAPKDPWSWIAASISGAAAVTALISQIQRFEHGGVIKGNSMHGDNILVRANAGEMVITPRQQSNLFRMLENGGAYRKDNGTVEFEIHGSTLHGVLNNYSKRMSKI